MILSHHLIPNIAMYPISNKGQSLKKLVKDLSYTDHNLPFDIICMFCIMSLCMIVLVIKDSNVRHEIYDVSSSYNVNILSTIVSSVAIPKHN